MTVRVGAGVGDGDAVTQVGVRVGVWSEDDVGGGGDDDVTFGVKEWADVEGVGEWDSVNGGGDGVVIGGDCGAVSEEGGEGGLRVVTMGGGDGVRMLMEVWKMV